MNESLNKLGKSSGIVFLGKIIEAGLLLLFNLLAVRLLGTGNYGLFIYIFNILQILSMVTKFGLDRGIINFVPILNQKADHKEVKNIISFTVHLTTILSLLIVMSVLVFSEFISNELLNNPSMESHLIVTMPLLILVNFLNLSIGIFRGIGEINKYIIAKNILIPLVMLISLFIFSNFIFNGYTNLTLVYYLSYIIASLYLLIYLIKSKRLSVFSLKRNRNSIDLMKFSMPLFLSTFSGYLLTKIDTFFIGYFMSNSSVGVYNILLQIAVMSSFVLTAFNTVFAPNISILYKENKINELRNKYQVITRWISLINFIFFGLILLLSKEILSIFGYEFSDQYMVLLILCGGQVLNAGVGPVAEMNVLTGKPRYEFYTMFVSLIINIVLNIILVPKFGLTGAAIASFISVGLINFILLFLLYKDMRIQPFNKDYFRILVGNIITIIFVYLLKINFEFNYLFSILIYSSLYIIVLAVILSILGIPKEEAEILKNKFKRKIKEK